MCSECANRQVKEGSRRRKYDVTSIEVGEWKQVPGPVDELHHKTGAGLLNGHRTAK